MNLSVPPVAVHAGSAAGGGLLSKLTGGAGAEGAAAGAKGDGSVGLFDGVLMKAAIGGAVGAGLGFLPFLPGGFILGGIVGSLVGAGYGMFKNWREMKKIKQENAAFVAQLGLNPANPEQAAALLSGQPQQLLTQAGIGQTAQVGQTAQNPVAVSPQQAAQQAAAQQLAAEQAKATAVQATVQASPVATPKQYYDDASGGEGALMITGGSITQAGQKAPPAVIDPSTQPATQTTAAIAPKQAELAAGGAGATDADLAKEEAELRARQERIARIWTDSDPEQQREMLRRLELRVQEIEALVRRLKASAPAQAA